MGTTNKGERTELTYYPSGKKLTEVTYVGEHIQGTTRRWYENGQLTSEVPVVNSMTHGIVRSWSLNGALIDCSRFICGSGWFRSYYPTGVLEGESAVFRGVPTGPHSCFNEDGTTSVELHFWKGRKISKKKYAILSYPHELQADGWQEDELLLVAGNNLVRQAVSSESREAEQIDDAMAWLTRTPRNGLRTLGELPSTEASINFICDIICAGAIRVFIGKPDFENDDEETTDSVLVLLPQDELSRTKIFNFLDSMNRDRGYNPTPDAGQLFFHVALS